MEAEPKTDEVLLRFVLDGVYYALEQNVMTRKQMIESLRLWFPNEVEIIDLPPQLHET